MARIASSHNALHRGIRVPDRRRGGFSPSGPHDKGRSEAAILPPGHRFADPPLRPERHIPNSIPTLRRRLIAGLIERLPRCPCCDNGRMARGNGIYDAVRLVLTGRAFSPNSVVPRRMWCTIRMPIARCISTPVRMNDITAAKEMPIEAGTTYFLISDTMTSPGGRSSTMRPAASSRG
jgi:hypothetical protein